MLPIGITGARQGDTLLGTGKIIAGRNTQNRGSLIRIYKKGAKPGDLIIPPDGDRIINFTDYAELKSYKPYRHMSEAEIKEYLERNAASDVYLSDGTDIEAELLQLTGEPFEKIPLDVMNGLMRTGRLRVPISDVYNAIPGNKADTKANRHTLVFRRSIWAVVDRTEVFQGKPDIIYDMETLHLVSKEKEGTEKADFLLDRTRMKEDESLKLRVLLPITVEGEELSDTNKLYQSLTGLSEDQINRDRRLLDPFLSKLTPGVLKSAIQKIIRTGAEFVTLPWTLSTIDSEIISHRSIQEKYPPSKVSGDIFLLLVFEYLYRSPGSFVPDLQLFVTGIESAFKRLGVSISEDAFTADYEVLLGLYVASMVVRTNRTWRPSLAVLKAWLALALEAKNDTRIFNYGKLSASDSKDLEKLKSPLGKQTPHYILYRVLSQLGSFPSDIQMVLLTNGSERPTEWKVELMKTMPIEQIVDQHAFPEIGYLMLSDRLKREENFTRLNRDIFFHVTGLNPRRTDRDHDYNYYRTYEEEEFTKQLRVAQRFILFSKTQIVAPPLRKVHKRGVMTVESYVDDPWLVGMLGVTEVVHKKIAYYVGLNASDIYSYMIMKRPTRNLEDGTVTQEAREAISKHFKEILKSGLRLKHVPDSLKMFKNAKLILQEAGGDQRRSENHSEGALMDDSYILDFGKNQGKSVTFAWEDAQRITERFKILEPLAMTFLNSITHVRGVSEGAEHRLDEILDNILLEPDVELRRLITSRISLYLSNNRTSIEMYKLSRSGEGQELPARGADAIVYKLLSDLTILYPAAIQRSTTSPTKRFDLVYAPLFWQIKEKILNRLQSQQEADLGWSDALREVKGGFHLYDYQQHSVERMLATTKRGSLVNGPTGVGKTAIALGFVRGLVEAGRMPRYCLYTLPTSAMTRIEDELRTMGIPHRFIRTTKGGEEQVYNERNEPVFSQKTKKRKKKGEEILVIEKERVMRRLPKNDGRPIYMRPYEVTLVPHDDLRRSPFPEAARALMKDTLLIVDEFHMAMANSQRTGTVMGLMNLCVHFVGMSATVIRSEDVTPVIAWLEQVVDFEVTKDNFWAAMSAMITLYVKLDIVTEHREVLATFTNDEATEYRTLLENNNGPQDFNKAVNLCHNVCLRDMLTKTEELLALGRYNKKKGERAVFFIAKNSAMAQKVVAHFTGILKPNEMHVIGKDSTISVQAKDKSPIRLLITTPSYSMGYDATLCTAVVESVYFVNQSIRDQLDGRLVRIGQDSEVTFYTFFVGILQNIWQRYKLSGSMSKALKGAGEAIGLGDIQLRKIE